MHTKLQRRNFKEKDLLEEFDIEGKHQNRRYRRRLRGCAPSWTKYGPIVGFCDHGKEPLVAVKVGKHLFM
jgi:hypothetical protein